MQRLHFPPLTQTLHLLPHTKTLQSPPPLTPHSLTLTLNLVTPSALTRINYRECRSRNIRKITGKVPNRSLVQTRKAGKTELHLHYPSYQLPPPFRLSLQLHHLCFPCHPCHPCFPCYPYHPCSPRCSHHPYCFCYPYHPCCASQ